MNFIRNIYTTIKNSYHTGFHPKATIALPLPPINVNCIYSNYVKGNKIQKIQLKTNNSYKTTTVIEKIFKTALFLKKYERNVVYRPTSHNSSMISALGSCRKLEGKNIDKIMYEIRDMLDIRGRFINLEENRLNILSIIEKQDMDEDQRTILKRVMDGVFSNYADSIYIANDYLMVEDEEKEYIIVANYPNGAEQREIERARIIATGLLYGQYPIILDKDVNFEGEANIKFLPYIFSDNCGKYHQLALSYDSSRSESKTIDSINIFLDKLGIPLIRGINILPKEKYKKIFYHQDCILNFSCNDQIKEVYINKPIESITTDDIIKTYDKNGTIIIAKYGIKYSSYEILSQLFKNIIVVNEDEDILGANMIVTNNLVVGSSNINKETREKIVSVNKNFLGYIHPSSGGGGAHKCCSNTGGKGKLRPISIEEWLEFVDKLNMDVSEHLIISIKDEIERLSRIIRKDSMGVPGSYF